MSYDKFTRHEQSKINGAKSQGPVTPEGKARSAVNNTKHGMYSSRVVLDNENPALYALLHSLYTDLLQPQDILETDLVENMVNARWKIRRLEASETANMNLTLSEKRHTFPPQGAGLFDPAMEHALTYRVLVADAKSFDTLSRFEERLHRLYERSYRLLTNHRRKSRQSLPSAAELRNLEKDLPDNQSQPPDPEKEGFEPEQPETPPSKPTQPSCPGILSKIAIIAILIFTLITANIRPAFAKTFTPFAVQRIK